MKAMLYTTYLNEVRIKFEFYKHSSNLEKNKLYIPNENTDHEAGKDVSMRYGGPLRGAGS